MNVGGVFYREVGGSRVDRRRSGVSEAGRHGHGAVIGHGQATKKCGAGSNICERGIHLPLAAPETWGAGALVRGGTGSRRVSSWAVSPVAPVTRALLPLISVSATSSPVSPRCGTDVIRSRAAAGLVVPSNARAPAVPVASAAVGAGAGPRAIAPSRMPVDPDVRGAVEGGVSQPRALPHVRELVSMVA